MGDPEKREVGGEAGARGRLAVVIVAYNVRELLLACLASLGPEVGEVVVVDNASTDGTAEAVRERAPCVRLIANRDNLGFSRANNQALRTLTAPYVCLLNPDTEVIDAALARLVAALETDPRLGIVGPRLLNPGGSPQTGGLAFPNLWTLLAQAVPWRRRPAGRRRRGARGAVMECDWVTGACMMIRREVLDHIGLLDEDYFMYGEEKDLCYRAKQAGWKVGCVTDAEVIHHGGQSADQAPVESYLAFLDSQFRFLRKFYPPRYRRVFGVANWIGCRLRQIGATVLGMLRPGQRPWWRQKAQVAQAGAWRCAEYLRGRR